MAELADALDLGSSGAIREGSSPPMPTESGPTSVVAPQQPAGDHAVARHDIRKELCCAGHDQHTLRGPAGGRHPAHERRAPASFRPGLREVPRQGRTQGIPQGQSPAGHDQEDLRRGDRARSPRRRSPTMSTTRPWKSGTSTRWARRRWWTWTSSAGRTLQFKIKYEVKPAVELKTYKGIAVERPVHPITDAEVDDEIQQLRKVQQHDDACRLGRGRRAHRHRRRAGAGRSGHAADRQEVAGHAVLSGRHHRSRRKSARRCATPTCRRAVTVKTLRSKHDDHEHTRPPRHHAEEDREGRHFPRLTRRWSRRSRGDEVTSPEEFRASMRERSGTVLDRNGRTARWPTTSRPKSSAQHEFTVPDSLVEAFLDSFVEEIRNRSRDRQLPAGFDEKKFREERRVHAVWQAKWMLMKERIAESEQIDGDRRGHRAARRAGSGADRARPRRSCFRTTRNRRPCGNAFCRTRSWPFSASMPGSRTRIVTGATRSMITRRNTMHVRRSHSPACPDGGRTDRPGRTRL